MATSRGNQPARIPLTSMLGLLKPAFQQIRQIWRLFVLLTMGLVAAVVLVCALPLFTLVSTTSGVRNTFNNTLYDPTSSVQMHDTLASSTDILQATNALKQTYRQTNSTFFPSTPILSLHVPDSPIWQNNQLILSNRMELHGYDMAHIASHISLLQGHLPQTNSDTLEVALSTSNVQSLQAHLGSTYTITIQPPNSQQPVPLSFTVVGIFQEVSMFDPFWHGDSFLSYYDLQDTTTYENAIISNDALLHLYDHWKQTNGGLAIAFPTEIHAFFPLDISAVNSTNLDNLHQHLQTLPLSLLTAVKPYHIYDFQANNADISTLISSAKDQTSIVQVPVLLLLALMLGLILFFAHSMTELLVTRQAAAIALFYTRGAMLPQIFLTFVTQSLFLGLLTLLLSPLVLMLVIRFPVQLILLPTDQQALNVLPTTPWGIESLLGWYPFTIVLVVVGAMCVAIWRALVSNTLGRSATLATRPFWQRAYLDCLLLLLGGLFYGGYTYLASTNLINAQLQILLSGPCSLVATALLCLGGVLLCLRGFPWLIQWGAKLAAKRRGILPMLPLVSLARVPRQGIRSALLLAVTIAFAFFALVFTATQAQRVSDVANYRVGADFSGIVNQAPIPSTLLSTNGYVQTFVDTRKITLQQAQSQSAYQHLAGVLSASTGYTGPHYFLHMNGSLTVAAIDPTNFPASVIWSQMSTRQSTMQQIAGLASARTLFSSNAPNASMPALPTLVDAQTAQTLHLLPGQRFTLADFGGQMQLVMIGEVAHIPSLNDDLAPANGGEAGILVDYASFVYDYQRFFPGTSQNLNPNMLWLHTRQDTASLSTVRRALTNGPLALATLNDRPGLVQTLQHDPLALDIQLALALGVGISLLLALMGYITSLWLAVKTRLQSLAVLRVLGTSPTQLLWLLGWEQGLIAAFAVVVGVGCGIIFTALALPSLVFSGVAQTGTISNAYTSGIYLLQFAPPLQIVIPGSLVLGLAVVIGLCLAALSIATYTAAHPSLAQTLRVEEYVEEVPLFVANTHETKKQTAKTDAANAPVPTERRITRRGISARTLSPVRSVWGYLTLTGAGIMVPIILVCVVPLFSQIASTAGLRDLLAQPSNQYATVSNNFSSDYAQYGQKFDAGAQVKKTTQQLNTALLKDSQPFFHDPATIKALGDTTTELKKTPGLSQSRLNLSFIGLSARVLPEHARIIQGTVPQPATILQIALTPAIAAYLHITLGETLTPQMGYPFPMQVVALFQPLSAHDAFIPTLQNSTLGPQGTLSTDVLVSTEGLFQMIASQPHTAQGPLVLSEVDWYYSINRNHLTIDQLDSMIATFSTLVQNGIVPESNLPINTLAQYQTSVQIAQVPVLTTSALIIGVILLFLSFMSDLLVEREISTIALLRSRGATRGQIFQAFLTRLLALSAGSTLLGLLLVIPTVIELARLVLSTQDQNALNLLLEQPLLALARLYPYILGCLVVMLGALSIALYRALGTTMLTLRQETARSHQKAFWQRYYLDVVGIFLALAAYASAWYLTKAGILDAQVNVLVKTPLVVATTVCLIVACMLAFLRAFPWLLRLGTLIAIRSSKRVEPMLALSQMSRSPRQHARVVLLLLIATTFVVFISVFSVSQNQHISDVASYWSGADFSGPLTFPVTEQQTTSLQNAYRHLAGVTAVAMGNVSTLSDQQSSASSIKIVAVDPDTFLQAVNWPQSMSTQQRQALIQQLTSQRTRFAHMAADKDTAQLANAFDQKNVLPVVVDAAFWQTYQLSPGQIFALYERLPAFQAIDHVDSLPSSGESGQLTDSADGQTITMLVDYQSLLDYQLAYSRYIVTQPFYHQQKVDDPLYSINYVWLKTNGKASALATIRQSVSTGPLQITSLADRYAIIQQLTNDPLNRNLVGILLLGGLAPLTLAWIGCLLACWVNVRQRQVLFGVLRSLGGTPGQVARVLLWEQTLLYGGAIALGTLSGLLTARITLPSLILTSTIPGGSTTSTLDLFSLQDAPAAHMVIVPSIGLVIGCLLLLGVLTLMLMYRATSRLMLAQTLRLNQD